MNQIIPYVGPPTSSSLDRRQVEGLLAGLGYKFLFRVQGWVECLVIGHGETWNGSGEDEDAALRDAVRRMFPSEAARALLEGRASSVLLETAPEPVVCEEPVVETVEVPPEPRTDEAPTTESLLITTSALAPSTPTPKSVPVIAVVEPLISINEAVDVLHVISAEIEDEAEDVAVMTSHLQRLLISTWIFRARSIQDQFPTHRLVEDTVHRIAIRLTSLCKMFWPGSVRALTVDTTPRMAAASLTSVGSGSVQNWDHANEVVQDAIERLAARPGTDEYGWNDADRLKPSSPDPDQILAEALEKIEAVLGPVKESPENRARRVSEEQLRESTETFLLAARLLRWVRRSVRDRVLWGAAFGALRWAARIGDLSQLRFTLDDDFVPDKSWAEILGRDPRINHQNRLKRELIATASVATDTRDSLVMWLQEAVAVFTNPQIAKMLLHARDMLLTLTNADFPSADRTFRSRLRRLQTIARTQEDVSSVSLPKLESLTDDLPVEMPAPVSNSIEDLLRDMVRERTRGKRMLFVSNREDEMLRVRLEEQLDCSVTLRDGSNNRKLQAIIASVASSSYDMVLMATGFHDHSSDASLARAAKAACVPYVRVNKGRPLATMRALARTFGFQESDQQAASAS